MDKEDCGMQNIFTPGNTWIGPAKYATKILASIGYHNIVMTDYPAKFESISI